jgi:protein-disulfide isomerase
MRWKLLALAMALLALSAVSPSHAQRADDLTRLREEIEALKQGQGAIQRQLQEVLEMLRGRGAAPSTAPQPPSLVRIDEAPFKGDPRARVTVVEFSDYQCQFCARHFRDTLVEIDRDYIRTGKVRYVFRDFPIASIHPQAFKAAEAAHCAGDQARYWEMHDRLFANQGALGRADLSGHAAALGLDLSAFEECLNTSTHAGRVQRSLLEGQQATVGGTPTFFLGVASEDHSSVRPARVIVGAQPYVRFKEALDSLLSAGSP